MTARPRSRSEALHLQTSGPAPAAGGAGSPSAALASSLDRRSCVLLVAPPDKHLAHRDGTSDLEAAARYSSGLLSGAKDDLAALRVGLQAAAGAARHLDDRGACAVVQALSARAPEGRATGARTAVQVTAVGRAVVVLLQGRRPPRLVTAPAARDAARGTWRSSGLAPEVRRLRPSPGSALLLTTVDGARELRRRRLHAWWRSVPHRRAGEGHAEHLAHLGVAAPLVLVELSGAGHGARTTASGAVLPVLRDTSLDRLRPRAGELLVPRQQCREDVR